MSRTFSGMPLLAYLISYCLTLSAAGVRPDLHAPINVMADHNHHAGEVMLSYRFMAMRMEGNRDGAHRLPIDSVLRTGNGDYMIAPTAMDMEMHMLGVMYAPTDAVTFMAMLPWTKNSMDHVTMAGGAFSTSASHMGDISVGAILPFSGGHLFSLGLSIPTGDQSLMDMTPMGRSILPYPMQVGSGTYDLMAGLGTSALRDHDSFGAQIRGLFRLGENDDGFALGNQVSVTAWYARNPIPNLSVSIRGVYENRGNYDGANPAYAMALANKMVPTVDPARRGGQRLDLAFGVNVTHESGHRLALEYQWPVWQKLDGPQLETDGVLTVGWQLAM